MVMRPSVYKPDILENAESAIRAGGRGTLSMSTEMSTEKEPKEDKENDDDAKDEPQSEPLNPEESSAPDGQLENEVNDNSNNVSQNEDTTVSSQVLEDTPKNKQMAEDPGFEDTDNHHDDNCSNVPENKDKQEAVSSQGLEDTPGDDEMAKDPEIEDDDIINNHHDDNCSNVPENKDKQEAVSSQKLENTPGDDEMAKDPEIEDDDIINNRHDDDVEMNSQSSDKTDPVPDNNEEKDEWSEGESATGETKDKGKSNDDSDDEGWGRPWRYGNWGQSKKSRKIVLPKLSRYSSFDTEQYRTGYPGKPDNPRITENFEFYTNEIHSFPEGDFVDAIHEKWWGNYDLLEYHHSYIQWLFPIRERGMNWHAKELQLHEIEKIKEDEKAIKRVLKSYKLMLDFYGLELEDEKSGEVKRSVNWEDRFRNLNYSSHNYLRITRILKCLGEFGFEHYKAPLIRRLLIEAITEKTLINALNSCVSYWIEVVKDDKEREELHSYAKTLVQEANTKLTAK